MNVPLTHESFFSSSIAWIRQGSGSLGITHCFVGSPHGLYVSLSMHVLGICSFIHLLSRVSLLIEIMFLFFVFCFLFFFFFFFFFFPAPALFSTFLFVFCFFLQFFLKSCTELDPFSTQCI